MPHQCLSCSRVYDNTSPELLKGCSCGARVFLFLRQPKAAAVQLKAEDKKLLEDEVRDLTTEAPVSVEFDIENVRVLDKGHYALNLRSLLSGDPLIVRNSQGVYLVRFPPVKPVLGDKKAA